MDQETEREINRIFEAICHKADGTPVTHSSIELGDEHPARIKLIADGLRERLHERYKTSVINVNVNMANTLVASITHQ
jgi:hypothetical protein